MTTRCARLLSLALLLISEPSFATLGKKVESIESDRASIKAVQKVSSKTDLYTVHEMDDAGVSIKEFASSDGTVFAVSWRGIRKPDLSVLLGDFYQEYDSVASQQEKLVSRRPTTVRTANVVVRKGGHMRDIRGKAFVPSLIPSGVNIEELPQ
jgi:hypothetical protein